MKVLYIDTSSNYLYTSVVDDDTILYEVSEEYGQNLSEVALPKIAFMFNEIGLKPTDIDKIIVVNGPGSFTGIRIGLTIAKVYAWSLKIPITTIYSLEAMALSTHTKKAHVPLINARRGYVFAAIYDCENKVILKPQHILLEKLQEKLDDVAEYEIVSNDKFEQFDNITSYSPDYLRIVDYYKKRKDINPHAVIPEYLKLTEAEESKNGI